MILPGRTLGGGGGIQGFMRFTVHGSRFRVQGSGSRFAGRACTIMAQHDPRFGRRGSAGGRRRRRRGRHVRLREVAARVERGDGVDDLPADRPLVAATSRLWVAVVTSVVAMLCFNFFFLPPVGTFTIADPQNWVALFAFLAVSLVASNLSAVARDADAGGGGAPRRAGAPVRPEPRRAGHHRQPRGDLHPGASDRPPLRPGVRRDCAAARRATGTCSRPAR